MNGHELLTRWYKLIGNCPQSVRNKKPNLLGLAAMTADRCIEFRDRFVAPGEATYVLSQYVWDPNSSAPGLSDILTSGWSIETDGDQVVVEDQRFVFSLNTKHGIFFKKEPGLLELGLDLEAYRERIGHVMREAYYLSNKIYRRESRMERLADEVEKQERDRLEMLRETEDTNIIMQPILPTPVVGFAPNDSLDELTSTKEFQIYSIKLAAENGWLEGKIATTANVMASGMQGGKDKAIGYLTNKIGEDGVNELKHKVIEELVCEQSDVLFIPIAAVPFELRSDRKIFLDMLPVLGCARVNYQIKGVGYLGNHYPIEKFFANRGKLFLWDAEGILAGKTAVGRYDFSPASVRQSATFQEETPNLVS